MVVDEEVFRVHGGFRFFTIEECLFDHVQCYGLRLFIGFVKEDEALEHGHEHGGGRVEWDDKDVCYGDEFLWWWG